MGRLFGLYLPIVAKTCRKAPEILFPISGDNPPAGHCSPMPNAERGYPFEPKIYLTAAVEASGFDFVYRNA